MQGHTGGAPGLIRRQQEPGEGVGRCLSWFSREGSGEAG